MLFTAEGAEKRGAEQEPSFEIFLPSANLGDLCGSFPASPRSALLSHIVGSMVASPLGWCSRVGEPRQRQQKKSPCFLHNVHNLHAVDFSQVMHCQ